jgi:hypothetical protein
MTDVIEHTAAVEVRIEHIADMMRSLEWRTGISGPILAKEWGLCEQRVKELSAEASKRVRAELMSPDNVKTDVGAALAIALRGAVNDKKWQAVGQIAKVYADASGASAPQKVEVGETPEATAARARQLIKDKFKKDVGDGLEKLADAKPDDASSGNASGV